MVALEVAGLSKRYGRVQALSDATFSVAGGEVFGYLGPNGAGKTTTLRIIAGLVRADRGLVRILGQPASRARAREAIGYLPGELRLHGERAARDVLDLFARFRIRRPPVLRDRLIQAFALEDRDLSRRVKFLSHGTRQKLGLVIAMQHDPDLLLLDEPTSGLDPLVQSAFRAVIAERAARGRAVLLSSHVLSEVEAVCGRAAVLGGGRVLALEPVTALRRRMLRQVEVRFRAPVAPALDGIPGVARVEIAGPDAVLWVEGDVNPLLRELARHDLERFVFPEARLEDAFLRYFEKSRDGRA